MNRSTLYLLSACLLWILPAFASAQECEERGRLRICPEQTADGTHVYRVTAHTNANYQEILAFANEGIEDARQRITSQQFDDANDPYVIYYCPGTTLCGGDGICRNGVMPQVNGDSVSRHYDTVCDGTGVHASRGLVSGVSYVVPAHRSLTASERANDAVVAIADDPRPTNDSLAAQAAILRDAGNDLEHPPSVLAMANGYNAMIMAFGRMQAAPAPAPAVVEAPVMPEAAVAPAATPEVVSERASGSNWLILACLLGMIATFLGGRAVGRRENKPLQELLGLKQEHSELKGVHSATKARVTYLEGGLRDRLKDISDLKDAARLKSEAAADEKRQRDNAPSPAQATEKNFSEIWKEVTSGALKTKEGLERQLVKLGRFTDVLTKDALEFLMKSTHANLQMQVAWAGAFGANTAFDAENIRQIGKGLHPRLERAVADAETRIRAQLTDELERGFAIEREALAKRAGSSSEDLDRVKADLVRANEAKAELLTLNEALAIAVTDDRKALIDLFTEKVRVPLYDLWRGIYGTVLGYDPASHRKVVDAQRIKEKFSQAREVIISSSNGSRRRRSNGHANVTEAATLHELKGPELTHFHREVHDALDAVMDSVDEVLGAVSDRHEMTPPPGAHPVSELANLLDDPDETETSEINRGDEPTQVVTRPRRTTDLGLGDGPQPVTEATPENEEEA